MSISANHLAERINKHLERRNLKQKDFAQLAGIPESTLSEVFGGTTKPSIRFLRKLSDALSKWEPGITPGTLLDVYLRKD